MTPPLSRPTHPEVIAAVNQRHFIPPHPEVISTEAMDSLTVHRAVERSPNFALAPASTLPHTPAQPRGGPPHVL